MRRLSPISQSLTGTSLIYTRFRCLGAYDKWINSNMLSSEIVAKITGSRFHVPRKGCANGEFRMDDQFALVPGNFVTHYFGTNYQSQLQNAKDEGWTCPCCHLTYLVLSAGAQIQAWPFYFSLRDKQTTHKNSTAIPSSKTISLNSEEAVVSESVRVWQHDKFPEQNCSSLGAYSSRISNLLNGTSIPSLCFEMG